MTHDKGTIVDLRCNVILNYNNDLGIWLINVCIIKLDDDPLTLIPSIIFGDNLLAIPELLQFASHNNPTPYLGRKLNNIKQTFSFNTMSSLPLKLTRYYLHCTEL